MHCPALVFGYTLLCGTAGEGGASADSVKSAERVPVPPPAVWVLTGASVVEGAWSADAAGLLQLTVVGLDAEFAAGLTTRVEVMSKWGHEGLEFAPSQGLSSLDAASFVGPGEVWLEWSAGADGKAGGSRVKAGWVDANSEFAGTGAASDFANPSFGLSPVLAMLPSYPEPAPSLNVFTSPWRGGAEAGAGVYRSVDGEWSAVAQLMGTMPRAPVVVTAGVAAPLAGAAGLDPAGYLIMERPPEEGVAAFGSLAVAGHAELWHVAGGFTAPLPAPSWLPETRFGLGTSVVLHGGGDETVAEAFISLRPLGWLVVQPHAQFRVAGSSDPAVAGLLRVTVER